MRISDQEKRQREIAREIITAKTDEICEREGLKFNRLAIRNQRTRLGSCSSKGNLNFNWQIIKFPDEIRDYIIIHEVCHLKHQNHSKSFWQEVQRIDPEYKLHHKWLKRNGRKLLKY